MHSDIPNELERRTIHYFRCNDDGKQLINPNSSESKDPYTEQKCRPHYFILLSDKLYNDSSHSWVGVPLTLGKTNFSTQYGFTLMGDDLEYGRDLAGSIVLYDRPCRLHKTDIIKANKYKALIRSETYKKVIEKISSFLTK